MIKCGDAEFDLEREFLVMGILNVTPDSFSDGGLYSSSDKAVERALELFEEGADVIDIGGESTNPFHSEPVSPKEETSRVLPIVKALVKKGFRRICIDTRHADTASACLSEGASWINDVSALTFDSCMVKAVMPADALVLMHSRGTPQEMQKGVIEYDDVVGQVRGYLKQRVDFCEAHGISRARIIVDPGIGFGKKLAHNIALLQGMESLKGIAAGVLSGVSRKSFLGEITKIQNPKDRDFATLGAVLHSMLNGANVVRVHNVKATREMLKVFQTLTKSDHRVRI